MNRDDIPSFLTPTIKDVGCVDTNELPKTFESDVNYYDGETLSDLDTKHQVMSDHPVSTFHHNEESKVTEGTQLMTDDNDALELAAYSNHSESSNTFSSSFPPTQEDMSAHAKPFTPTLQSDLAFNHPSTMPDEPVYVILPTTEVFDDDATSQMKRSISSISPTSTSRPGSSAGSRPLTSRPGSSTGSRPVVSRPGSSAGSRPPTSRPDSSAGLRLKTQLVPQHSGPTTPRHSNMSLNNQSIVSPVKSTSKSPRQRPSEPAFGMHLSANEASQRDASHLRKIPPSPKGFSQPQKKPLEDKTTVTQSKRQNTQRTPLHVSKSTGSTAPFGSKRVPTKADATQSTQSTQPPGQKPGSLGRHTASLPAQHQGLKSGATPRDGNMIKSPARPKSPISRSPAVNRNPSTRLAFGSPATKPRMGSSQPSIPKPSEQGSLSLSRAPVGRPLSRAGRPPAASARSPMMSRAGPGRHGPANGNAGGFGSMSSRGLTDNTTKRNTASGMSSPAVSRDFGHGSRQKLGGNRDGYLLEADVSTALARKQLQQRSSSIAPFTSSLLQEQKRSALKMQKLIDELLEISSSNNSQRSTARSVILRERLEEDLSRETRMSCLRLYQSLFDSVDSKRYDEHSFDRDHVFVSEVMDLTRKLNPLVTQSLERIHQSETQLEENNVERNVLEFDDTMKEIPLDTM